MKASWRVRVGTAADLQAVLELQRAVPEAPQWGEASYRAALDSGLGESGRARRLLVAVENANGTDQDRGAWRAQPEGLDEKGAAGHMAVGVIGFAVGQVMRVGGEVEAEIESVAVAEVQRRGGVGRALCEELLAWFRPMRARRVELEVRLGSGGAIALYRSLGFSEQGRRRGYYVDPADDALLMQLRGKRTE